MSIHKINSLSIKLPFNKRLSNMALGTAFYSLEEYESQSQIIKAFLDAGGTLIDSGRIYRESEAVLGKFFASHPKREDVVLITKCAHGDSILPAENFEATVSQEIEISLQTLNTDYIDIYMLHRDNEAVPVQRIMDRMNQEIEKGTVKSLGASNWKYHRVDEANAYAQRQGMHGFTVVSNNLSLAKQEEPFYPGLVQTDETGELWHKEHQTPLLSWSSLARGFFSGFYNEELVKKTQADKDTNGFIKRMVEVYCVPDNFERFKRAKRLGESKGEYTPSEIALSYLINKPFPVIPIVGVHNIDELHSCIHASHLTLTTAELDWLDLKGITEDPPN